MDVQEAVLVDFAERVASKRPNEIRGTREAGVYATKVRINAPQGSTFNGNKGVVVWTHDDRTAFVRFRDKGREIVLPFGYGELEVLP